MLARFLRLRPAKFSRAAKPLEAMDWLRSINKDLVTTGCTDAEKVRFAAHLLEGPAASLVGQDRAHMSCDCTGSFMT
jgi:hypothetical protein